MTPNPAALAAGEQIVGGALIEDVVDHLNRVDVTGCHQPENGLRRVVVDRNAKEPDLPVALQPLDGLEPVTAVQPVVGPDMELLEIDFLQSEIPKALLRALDDPVGRERLIRRDPRGAGQMPFFGGIFVAMTTESRTARTPRPTSRSLCPAP